MNLKSTYSTVILVALSFLTACQSAPSPNPTQQPEILEAAPDTSRLLELLPQEPAPEPAEQLVGNGNTDINAQQDAELALTELNSAPTPPEFWHSLRGGFALDLSLENKRIKAQRNWYAKHQNYINRVLERGEPYLYFIYSEAKRRGIPHELVLLPIVESAFDPFAYSHGRASGIWQFVPATGKFFGLKQTWWYDGRRDIYAATHAAFNYLEALNKQFNGNWLHALAAYNAGAGNVRKGIRRNKKLGKPIDFWSLKLPKETQAYVPKLIALAQIFQNPEKYGIKLRPIDYAPQFAKIETQSQIDLSQAATLANIPLEELYRYNPAFNRWATDPVGPHYLLIPIQQAESFEAGLAQMPPEKRVQWSRYKIKAGDSLIGIAKKNHTTVKVIRSVNGIKGNRIVAGKTLLIPKASKSLKEYTLSLEQRLAAKQNRPRSGRHKTTYHVKGGDSFWTISRQFKVNMRALAKWNGMAPTDTLRTGQKLIIWTNVKTAGSNSKIRRINYRARNGDSYAKIAQKFNVTLAQLKRWNSIDTRKYLQPGDKLTLYVDVRKAP